MCFCCHDKVVIKGKEVYYPFQLLALAFISLVKPSHHLLVVHLATMTQWHHFLTSYPGSPFPPVKLRTPFVQPTSLPSTIKTILKWFPPSQETCKSSLQFLPYTFKHVEFSALLENVLLTQLPSLAAAIYFFPFTVKLFNFQISSLYLRPPFFPLTYPGIRLLFLLLCKERIPHPHPIIIMAYLC